MLGILSMKRRGFTLVELLVVIAIRYFDRFAVAGRPGGTGGCSTKPMHE